MLVRNPFFHVWSAEGSARTAIRHEIVEKYGLQISEAEVTQVERGAGRRGVRRRRHPGRSAERARTGPKYASQVLREPADRRTEYMALNTRTRNAPFNNVRKARQAINYAADRSAIVKICGGPCTRHAHLPDPAAGLPRPTRGRTARTPPDPGDDEVGTAPTWPRLKAAGPGVRHQGPEGCREQHARTRPAKAVRRPSRWSPTLRTSIGYKARRSSVLSADGIQYPYVQNSEEQQQGERSAWSATGIQDYPAPVRTWLNVLLSAVTARIHPNSDASAEHRGVLRPRASRSQIDREAESSPERHRLRLRPTKLWTKVDHEATTDAGAVGVDLFNPKQIDFVSKRVGNYYILESNVQWAAS